MNTLATFDPFTEVFPDLFRGLGHPVRSTVRRTKPTGNCRLDVKEADGQYVVYADIPGVSKDQINVEIDGDTVSISATVKSLPETAEGERMLRTERYQGDVSRTVVMATEINEDEATANFENGVLTLTLPKKVAPSAKRVAIS